MDPKLLTQHAPEVVAEIKKELARRSFREFVRQAWPIIEPGTPLVWGWVVDAICEHLEAVTQGDIKRLVINVPPGPMRDDSIVTTNRGRKLLKDIAVGDMVLTHKGRYREVSGVHHQGVLPILKITTNSGRVTHAAPTHPYLTPKGWVEAGDLRVGDYVAVVTPEEDRQENFCTPEEARLFGYLVGDGSMTQKVAGFTNKDWDSIEDFCKCVESVGFRTSVKKRYHHWHVSILGGPPVREYFERIGLMWKSSYQKRIPDVVMKSGKDIMSHFLGAYWACDGSIDVRNTRSRGSTYRAFCSTVNRSLADDLLHVCGVLGIRGRLRNRVANIKTKAQPSGRYLSYNIEIQREVDTGRFADMPGLSDRKRKLAEKCRRSFDQVLWEDEIVSIETDDPANCMCLTVEEDHSFVCSDIAVKNTMKSKLTSVLWPTWSWLHKSHYKFLSASYALSLAERNNVECRRILQSEWYSQNFGIGISAEEGGKVNFSTDKLGVMRAISVGGATTGYRGDAFLIDDPHDVSKADSDAKRSEAVQWFIESAQTRLNSLRDSSIVVVMQRVHEEDVTAVALEMGYEHLCIPMRWDESVRKTTSIGWTDPRKEEGELMWPERFPKTELDTLEKNMGAYAVAAQMQQRPAPRKGGLFAVDNIKIIEELPDEPLISVRAWDLAASEGAGAYSVGVLMHYAKESEQFIIGDVKRKQLGAGGVRQMIQDTAEEDGTAVQIILPQDPGQAGKAQVEDYIHMLLGYDARAEAQSGAKETRAGPLSAQIEIGKVSVLQRVWTKALLDEMRFFPKGKFKDQVDAASSAFNALAAKTRVAEKRKPLLSLVSERQDNWAKVS
jgi:predicted phage terminase large subunit-like protein